MQAWIGTSGYSYPDWVGAFYPSGTRSGGMLAHYARCFPLVELNFSFYRLPTPSMLARIADQTPVGFQFLVKVPRTISHENKPDELDAFRLAAGEMHKRGKLLGLLLQLPQANHHGKRQKAWIELVGRALGGYGVAVEFRHRSWTHDSVQPWLAEQGLHLVAVDVPDIAALYPAGLMQSTSTIYVRFHSRDAAKWYAGEKERYDYHYDDASLIRWITSIRAAQAERVLLLFNNCMRSQAADNARRMGELLKQLAPEVDVIAATDTEPRQQLLFD